MIALCAIPDNQPGHSATVELEGSRVEIRVERVGAGETAGVMLDGERLEGAEEARVVLDGQGHEVVVWLGGKAE